MRRIFILTEGGRTQGMGHIARCLSVYQAFRVRGYSPEIIVDGDESTDAFLHGTNYRRHGWIKQKNEILPILNNSDIIVIDSYYCPEERYRELSECCHTAAFIDDNVRVAYPEGVVINGVVGAEQLSYCKSPGITYLLGENYSFLREAFWDVSEKKIEREVRTVMIACGGNDLNGLSLRILKVLEQDFPEVRKLVLLKQLDAQDSDVIKRSAEVYANLTAAEMRNLMIEADLAISAGGQTTYELCRIGTPFIALNTAENQTFSVNNLRDRGLIYPAITPEDPDFEKKIVEQFTGLSEYSLRRSRSKAMQNTITGTGSINITDHLISTLN